MQACTLIARAKINLYLEILGSRPDGYSEVAMVLQSIHLADRLQLKSRPHGIHLTCDRPEVPADARNLAYQAAELLQKECHSAAGVEIHIEKHIPVAAGLAGGSADAAAVLVGLNQLWGLGLTVGELQSLAARLGSDIPFCIQGGNATGHRARGSFGAAGRLGRDPCAAGQAQAPGGFHRLGLSSLSFSSGELGRGCPTQTHTAHLAAGVGGSQPSGSAGVSQEFAQ